MKLIHYIYISAALVLLSACNDEEIRYIYSVGESDNAIVLRAGIGEGGASVQTRAVDGSHSNHVAFSTTNATQLRLRVDGTWRKSSSSTVPVSQCTTATTGNETGTGNKHNELTFSPVLYWDDYGMADPENKSLKDASDNEQHDGNGRDKGLTIYGVAVNEKSLPTADADGRSSLVLDNTSSNWTSIAWNVGKPSNSGVIDQSTNGWGDYDLLTSNNIRESRDGTYKFEDFLKDKKDGTTTSSNLLEFTHAMSKITFVLTAGDGFPLENSVHKFENTPEVTLTSRKGGDTTTPEWVQTTGTVNVENGTVSLAAIPEKASIRMHHSGTDATTKKVTLDALIFPGSVFADRVNSESPYPVIARIEADGNIYYITTEKIRAAITTKYGSGQELDFKTQPGINYIFNVTINKTEIEVNATVVNWETVNSEIVAPVIDVNTSFSGSGSATPSGFNSFSFYRSASDPASQATNILSGYSADNSLKENGYYKPEGVPTGNLSQQTAWTFTNKLHWPNHNTHYHFRGVWPTTVTTPDANYTGGTYDWVDPRVKDVSGSDATQIIDIKNVAYSNGSFPSDLLIGMPEFTAANKNCTNNDHTHVDQSVYGICATEGLITLNFKYIMSQVEVVLLTSSAGSIDYVNIGDNTVVEIVNVYNNGYVKLGDRSVVGTDANKGNYTLDPVTGTGNELKRHSAIVPQTLTYTNPGDASNVRFKITVTNNDAVLYADVTEYNAAMGTSLDATAFANLSVADRTKTPATQDIYYADIEPILKSGTTDKVAPNGKWESGVHYVYNLKLTKTDVNVTATLTDWVTVNAEESIWF